MVIQTVASVNTFKGRQPPKDDISNDLDKVEEDEKGEDELLSGFPEHPNTGSSLAEGTIETEPIIMENYSQDQIDPIEVNVDDQNLY